MVDIRENYCTPCGGRWSDFSTQERGLIEQRILGGPRQWIREEPEEYTRRKAITSAAILGWLQLQGCELSGDTQAALPELRRADERWRIEWDASADDSHESRGGYVGVNTDASKLLDAPLSQVVPLALEHTKRPFTGFTEYRPFDGLVKAHLFRAVSALSFEARNERYPTAFWQSALSDWPEGIPNRLRCFFAARIVSLPINVISDLRFYIPRWWQINFLKLAQVASERYWPLWDAVVDRFFTLGPEGNESAMGDPNIGGKPIKRSRRTTEFSINSPMGVFSETLFRILDGIVKEAGQGIPSVIRSRLEKLFDAPGAGADYAVCETTRRLRWLFAVDPDWTNKAVIPLFDLRHPRSEPAWNGLLCDNALPEPQLFSLLKPRFMSVFPQSSSWEWGDGPILRLNEFLVVASFRHLKDNRYLSYAEARAALQQATEQGREHAIWFLSHIVRDLGEWKQFGRPFIEQAWPRERKYQTSTSSRNFVHLAEESGDNFPDVVKTILPLLGPIDRGEMLVHSLKKDGDEKNISLAFRFPEPALSLLDQAIPEQPVFAYYELRVVLDLIVSAEPRLGQDARWRRLDALA